VTATCDSSVTERFAVTLSFISAINKPSLF
jgi:hypothetical protein